MSDERDDLQLRNELPLGAAFKSRARAVRLNVDLGDVPVFRPQQCVVPLSVAAQLRDETPEQLARALGVAIDSDEPGCWWCHRDGIEREAVAALTTTNRTHMCERHLGDWGRLLDGLAQLGFHGDEAPTSAAAAPTTRGARAQKVAGPSDPRGSQSDGPPYLGARCARPRAAGGNRPKGEKTSGEK